MCKWETHRGECPGPLQEHTDVKPQLSPQKGYSGAGFE